jgi:hypothetical protein
VSVLELGQEGALPVESTTTDFRSDRMESAEGFGRARNAWQKAWNKYLETMDKHAGPVMEPYLKPIAARLEAGMLGFWLLWRLEGASRDWSAWAWPERRSTARSSSSG